MGNQENEVKVEVQGRAVGGANAESGPQDDLLMLAPCLCLLPHPLMHLRPAILHSLPPTFPFLSLHSLCPVPSAPPLSCLSVPRPALLCPSLACVLPLHNPGPLCMPTRQHILPHSLPLPTLAPPAPLPAGFLGHARPRRPRHRHCHHHRGGRRWLPTADGGGHLPRQGGGGAHRGGDQ